MHRAKVSVGTEQSRSLIAYRLNRGIENDGMAREFRPLILRLGFRQFRWSENFCRHLELAASPPIRNFPHSRGPSAGAAECRIQQTDPAPRTSLRLPTLLLSESRQLNAMFVMLCG